MSEANDLPIGFRRMPYSVVVLATPKEHMEWVARRWSLMLSGEDMKKSGPCGCGECPWGPPKSAKIAPHSGSSV